MSGNDRSIAIAGKRFATPAGVQVAYPIGTSVTVATVTFARAEIDGSYGVLVEPSWLTTHKVSSKAASQFVIAFGSVSGTADTVAFVTFRDETA